MEEIHKEIHDLALESMKSLKSEETGYVHTFYGKKEGPHQSISVVDNALFVLALCRSKTVEGVQEGKALLHKLLAYQLQDGFFPGYLHEFPFCHDRHAGSILCLVFYQIYAHFHKVLGTEISGRLLTSLEKLIEALMPEGDRMSLPNRFRLGGVLIGLGKQKKNEDWIAKGSQLIDLEAFFKAASRYIPEHLGDALSGLIAAEHPETKKLLGWMKKLWNPHLYSYAGPFVQVMFQKGMQQGTLYDWYMAAESGHLPARMKTPSLSAIKGALLHPFHLPEGTMAIDDADVMIGQDYSYSWVKERKNQPYFSTLQWGSVTSPAFFVFATALGNEVLFEKQGAITVNLQSLPDPESKEGIRELWGFFTEKPGIKIQVNGKAATTFRLEDEVTLEDDLMKIRLVFKASEGTFLGHISKGCMPTEMDNFGKNRFNAYQWQLFLRTIDRKAPCRLSMQYQYETKAS